MPSMAQNGPKNTIQAQKHKPGAKLSIQSRNGDAIAREALLDPYLSRSKSVIDHANVNNKKASSGTMKENEKGAECTGFLKQCQSRKFPPLKLIIMSASLDARLFSEYFGGARAVHVEGRQHHVDIFYTLQAETDYVDAALITIFQIHLEEGPGDILVFLTGQEEIEGVERLVQEQLQKLPEGSRKLLTVPIFSSLPSEQQMRVFMPAPAGCRREGPGKCFRLYPESEFEKLADSTKPEIKRCNLSNVILQLKALGIDDVLGFDFLEKPSRAAIQKSLEQLFLLGALTDDCKLSDPVGHQMARLPLDPIYSKALILANQFNCLEEMLIAVAMLSVESIFYNPREKSDEAKTAKKCFASPDGDHLTLINVYRAADEVLQKRITEFGTEKNEKNIKGKNEKILRKWCKENFINGRSLRQARDIHSQIRGHVEQMNLSISSCGDDSLQFRRCLAASFFLNAAWKQPEGTYRVEVLGMLLFQSSCIMDSYDRSCLTVGISIKADLVEVVTGFSSGCGMGRGVGSHKECSFDSQPILRGEKKASKRGLNLSPFVASSNGRTGRFFSLSSSENKKKKVLSFDDQLDDQDSNLISEQALAAALLFRHHQRNNGNSPPFTRSNSVVYPSPGSKKQGFTRSSRSRPRSHSDSLLKRPNQIVNQDLETNHVVLVHGGGFGAWCWYKTISLLQEAGFKVDAVDLTGSGIHYSDTNSIRNLAEYVKPLSDILDTLGEGDKVILVGHDFGGACISYVMELFPSKIAKAVFIAAIMLSSGQSALDIFSQQTGSSDLIRQPHTFMYANGTDNPPTAIDIDKTLLRECWFNQSSTKDVALASVSMRPIPFAPVLEKLSLSGNNYGSIPRFYIKTQEDRAMPVPLQESMIKSNPPTQVFQLKVSQQLPLLSELQLLSLVAYQIQIAQKNMGRGVSAGGGQSSLGYLFGSGEAPKPGSNIAQAAPSESQPANNPPPLKPAAAPQPAEINKQVPAGINSTSSNNYMRADGQNTGNFITDRPSTKVHAAPGGGSSLGYLFGGGNN
ncbi:unnamed protein product [Dovyalis caffra]|uniref:RNA helicase n=1 Tax=Dovyalis caffra TaxID=77055 RepID=A0AAV1R038_9ROSI|nr:unnamed protein product [Dovyalis caffra]